MVAFFRRFHRTHISLAIHYYLFVIKLSILCVCVLFNFQLSQFLFFISNFRYMKNNASSCNTPRQLQVPSSSECSAGQLTSSTLNRMTLKSEQVTSEIAERNNSNKSISLIHSQRVANHREN